MINFFATPEMTVYSDEIERNERIITRVTQALHQLYSDGAFFLKTGFVQAMEFWKNYGILIRKFHIWKNYGI